MGFRSVRDLRLECGQIAIKKCRLTREVTSGPEEKKK
jgi:hypothetical protein